MDFGPWWRNFSIAINRLWQIVWLDQENNSWPVCVAQDPKHYFREGHYVTVNFFRPRNWLWRYTGPPFEWCIVPLASKAPEWLDWDCKEVALLFCPKTEKTKLACVLLYYHEKSEVQWKPYPLMRSLITWIAYAAFPCGRMSSFFLISFIVKCLLFSLKS